MVYLVKVLSALEKYLLNNSMASASVALFLFERNTKTQKKKKKKRKETRGTMILLLLLLVVLSKSGMCVAFTPKDHYLLFCGPSINSVSGVQASVDGRVWSHDQNSTFSSNSSLSSSSITALASNRSPGIPFTAARIFKSNFTYSFPVSPGPKFLRLFFYPALYDSQYDSSQFFVTVQANGYILLRNFSAQLAVEYAPSTVRQNASNANQYVVKEYYLPVPEGELSLNLTFSPNPQRSYAFINGIELVSVPDSLYITDSPVKNVDSLNIPFQFSNSSSTALETAYRLNVGGTDVTDGETPGMYRQWNNDDPYTFLIFGSPGMTKLPIKYTEQVPNYTAPETVYQTYRQLGYGNDENMKLNLTWRFKVDPSFHYMVRLHWCEDDVRVIANQADRIFEVYINNQTVENDADVMLWADNQIYVPVYRDYVVFATGGDGTGGSVDLWISLHPSTQISSAFKEVLLNGLEIFKINGIDGSLDSPNPHGDMTHDSKQDRTTISPKRSHLPAIIGGIVAIVVLITFLACLLIFRRLKSKKESASEFGTSISKSSWLPPSFQWGSKTTASERGSTLPSHLCRRFSLAQIRLATNDFSEGLIVGHGGFGNVYKGMVEGENGTLAVAIKRLNVSSKQGVREFVTEIDLLSKLRHIHLVSLIGFCDDGGEMILVYEYMDRGTLREHLYQISADKPALSWNQRVNACLGAAKGLHYLHCGASQMIIHRDVKSTNILLDDKWVSKVSDFGLSKLGPMGGDLSHVSTAVKGSIGYLDLEYYKTQRLTEKSDVYSLGVVLFEVLCGRPAVDVSLPKEQVNLAKWARGYQRKGTLDVIVDPNIKDEIVPASLRKFGEIAERCVSDRGSDRPSMADVVWSLEFVLDLQEKAADSILSCNTDHLSSTTQAVATVDASAAETAMGSIGTGSGTHDDFNFSTTSGERMARTNSSSALMLSSSGDYNDSNSANVFSEIFTPLGR